MIPETRVSASSVLDRVVVLEMVRFPTHAHQGEGVITTQLYFMPDVEVTCGACKGARFNAETLEVTLAIQGATPRPVANSTSSVT